MKCSRCRSTKFRPSKLRARDVIELLRLRYPVRCRSCSKRSFAPLLEIFEIRRSHKLSLNEEPARGENGEASTPGPA
jgi:hypothetical protein